MFDYKIFNITFAVSFASEQAAEGMAAVLWKIAFIQLLQRECSRDARPNNNCAARNLPRALLNAAQRNVKARKDIRSIIVTLTQDVSHYQVLARSLLSADDINGCCDDRRTVREIVNTRDKARRRVREGDSKHKENKQQRRRAITCTPRCTEERASLSLSAMNFLSPPRLFLSRGTSCERNAFASAQTAGDRAFPEARLFGAAR